MYYHLLDISLSHAFTCAKVHISYINFAFENNIISINIIVHFNVCWIWSMFEIL